MTTPTTLFAFLNQLGPLEIGLVLFLVLLLFGAKKLPELAKGMGKAMKEFKKATRDVEEDIKSAMEDDPTPTQKKETPKAETPPSSPDAGN